MGKKGGIWVIWNGQSKLWNNATLKFNPSLCFVFCVEFGWWNRKPNRSSESILYNLWLGFSFSRFLLFFFPLNPLPYPSQSLQFTPFPWIIRVAFGDSTQSCTDPEGKSRISHLISLSSQPVFFSLAFVSLLLLLFCFIGIFMDSYWNCVLGSRAGIGLRDDFLCYTSRCFWLLSNGVFQ